MKGKNMDERLIEVFSSLPHKDEWLHRNCFACAKPCPILTEEMVAVDADGHPSHSLKLSEGAARVTGLSEGLAACPRFTAGEMRNCFPAYNSKAGWMMANCNSCRTLGRDCPCWSYLAVTDPHTGWNDLPLVPLFLAEHCGISENETAAGRCLKRKAW